MRQIVLAVGLAVLVVTVPSATGGEVSGRVMMPEVCSPAVSPAVVRLGPVDGQAVPARSGGRGEVVLVDQQGLQFAPRVRALVLGETVRFTNQDSETHNVHVVTPGYEFNQSMAPGQPREFVPGKAGVVRLACDIHSHMRGYIIVSPTPWVQVCGRSGRFRLTDVPEGRYALTVWHEMGAPLRQEVTVQGPGAAVDVGTLTLTVATIARQAGATAPVRPWSDVVDRIGVLLAASLDAATEPKGADGKKARTLAEDAYWGEFEASDMETAVRTHLGFARAGALETQFRALVPAVRATAAGRTGPEPSARLSRQLLLSLAQVSDELNRKGVTDRAHVFHTTTAVAAAPALGDRRARLAALKRGFQHVRDVADQGDPAEAASLLTAVYWDDFEPLERFIAGRKPQDVRPLEIRFNTLRGETGAGLKGPALAGKCAGLQTEIEAALRRSEQQAAGTFGPAFAASFLTVLREGAEVILLLAMLFAVAAKAGRAGAKRAVWGGVAVAVAASLLTALGLNRLVASSQGPARELLEGGVLLAAAGVLFSVSYWLIAQGASQRWLGFLKRQAQIGGAGTLAVTAFLAVYREGAETALMFQALIGSQGQARAGLLGVAAGLGVGLLGLAAVALVVRTTSVRLPLRAFFKLTGAVLFVMAVVFAGNGVFALQESGLIRNTPLAWLGSGLPALGLHPNAQTLSVQGVLVAGAVLAVLLMGRGERPPTETPRVAAQSTAGVGA